MLKRYDAISSGIDDDIEESDTGYFVPYGDYAILEQENAALEQRCKELLEAEHTLSDAYLRLRSKLMAFDTTNAPTREQVWEHTEQKLDVLLAENAFLRKRLEPIEEWWERNCSEYIRSKHKQWDASMYEVISDCMQMAPETTREK